MAMLTSFLFGYLIGGFTFLPLLAIVAYFCLTRPPNKNDNEPSESGHNPSIEVEDIAKQELAGLPSEVLVRQHDPGDASGYFAVTRVYVPGGVSSKPPERSTPAGSTIGGESPSVYQTMYRSIFERNKQSSPSMDASKGNARGTKRSRNVFYVVLRFAHLILFDDENQLEVRYIISLDQYDIDIFGGEERIPDGELFVKRNSIRIRRGETASDLSVDSKPFFFFSDNCSNKEDFYHALLNTKQPRQIPLHFEHDHMVKLVRVLHATEDNMQTRWANALLGRLFLSLYKTSEFNNFISTKIAKKISRVQRPAFIERIELQKIDTGDSAPLITNPKLKELNLEGDLTVEADIKYHGNFRLEVSALAKIDLGQRFKPREVTLMLAAIVKSLEGHVLFRIKPPPSNRIWFSFETMPKLDLTIEPVVSTRQITYGVILRAIESRIREVIRETLVQPNWDDVPFFNTLNFSCRGGLWEDASSEHSSKDANTIQIPNEEPTEGLEIDETISDAHNSNASLYSKFKVKEKSMSTPTLIQNEQDGEGTLQKRRTVPNMVQDRPSLNSGVSSSLEVQSVAKPKAMRSKSFAAAATPVVSKDPATAGTGNEEVKEHHNNAIAAVDSLSEISQVTNLLEPSVESRENSIDTTDVGTKQPSPMSNESSDHHGQDARSSISKEQTPPTPTLTKRQSIATTAASATASAAKWGFDMIQRRKEASAAARAQRIASVSKSSIIQDTKLSTSDSKVPSSPDPTDSSRYFVDSQTPVGRGQPLPPPGQPLPGPRQGRLGWATASFGNLTRRKPVPNRETGKADMGHNEASSEIPSVDVANATLQGRQESQKGLFSEGDTYEESTEDLGRLEKSSDENMTKIPPPLPPRRHDENVVNLDNNNNNGTCVDGSHSEEKSLDHEPAAEAVTPGRECNTLDHTDIVSNGDADFGEWEENLPVSPAGDSAEHSEPPADLATNTDNELEETHLNAHYMGDDHAQEDSQSDLIEPDSLQTKKSDIQVEHTTDTVLGESITLGQE